MPSPQFLLLLIAVLTCSAGCVGIACYRCGQWPGVSVWGRRLFLGVMLLLAILTVLLAYEPQRGVIYLGLAVATLVIAMLWEAPEPRPQRTWSGEPNVELPAAR